MIGKTVSHYEILEKLGGGGMGVVFKARDLKLDRLVALKFLPPHLVSVEAESDRLQRERFVLEAKASSALDHPNIGVLYEIGETEEGETFIAMAYYEGETLRQKLAGGSLPLDDAVSIAEQIAWGLAKAHEGGIVHRDIKPANIIVTRDGVVKIIDFGLAKLQEATRMTRRGAVMGTPAYMSPEQARGDDVDARTDLWSLGVVFYEMLTGQVPFRGGHESAVIHSILHDVPRPAREVRNEIPSALERVVVRALEKDREGRIESASEFAKALSEQAVHPKARVRTTRGRMAALGVAAVLVLASAAWFFQRSSKVRWAREQALPEILRLVEEGDSWDAFALALEAERYIPTDPMLVKSMPEISTHVSIETNPPGADVHFKRYEAVEGDWEYLGRTPIVRKRIPRGYFRWRVGKPSFQTFEQARSSGSFWAYPFGEDISLQWTLDEEGIAPPGMVKVPGGSWFPEITGLESLPDVELGDYWIDRYEVTNREFKEFVDRGGYQKREYWKQPFTRNGRELSWEEAMKEFRDVTGRPGPATWELGNYPQGKDDYPLSGVSWYEAAAYAQFAGTELPTIYHWSGAAGTPASNYVEPLSNIEGRSQGLSRAGGTPGMSRYGANDMAGNVKEWCWNEGRDGKKYILGGAWSEPSYMFTSLDAYSPWDRSATNGFRTVKRVSNSPLPPAATGLLLDAFRDYTKEKPVSDDVFALYRSLYSYDKTPLNATIESVDEAHDGWRREKITFDAPYGKERVTAYLFVPRKGKPPYQTVLFFPGGGAITTRTFQEQPTWLFDFIMASGRALMYPIYKGTFERGDGLESDNPAETDFYRDHVLAWSNEVGRSIDYLETRDDIDSSKIAYYGLSWGGALVQLPAVESRLKVVVLVAGGFHLTKTLPEVDEINFAPRVTAPVLTINGRSDVFCPVETCVEPSYRFLGTPEKDKRLVITDSGHVPPRNELIKETLDWLDRYLGPVQ